MTHARDTLHSADERKLPFRARGDLQMVRAAYSGQGMYVVRDPVTQDVFQLTPQEHGLFEQLRAPATLRSLQRFFERRFAPLRATTQQIYQFIQRLYDQGLLLSEQPGQGAALYDRGRKRDWVSRLMSLLQVLAIRVGGVTPGRMINGTCDLFGWLFSPVGVALVAAYALLAAATLIAGAGQLAADVPQLAEMFTARTLPIWIASIIAVKVLHELGHAAACRRFGGQCQEIGVLLLAGLPTLYCDVSDAWRIPSKWRRMVVSAAGMYVELIIAATAVLVWRSTYPGVIHSICISLVVVCSVGTLLVNANPLLRYDGYYLLSDLLETPNLAERSRGLWTEGWRRWLLGQRSAVDPLLGPYKRIALRIYAVAAKFYLTLVLLSIFAALLRLARPHHLENAVYAVAATALLGLLVQPALTASRLAKNPLLRGRIRKGRLLLTAVALAGGAAIVLAWPITRRVAAPIVVVPAKSHPLFATAAGTLEFAVPPGARVEPNDVVVKLHDDEAELALVQQEGVVRQRETMLNQLRTLRSADPTVNELIPAARAELVDAEAQLGELKRAATALTIRATAAGAVLGPPDLANESTSPDTLPAWRGSPLKRNNLGAWIEPGTAVAAIAEGDRLVAWAAVDQADIGAVVVGQPARLVAEQSPTRVFAGRVVRVSRRARENRLSNGHEPNGESGRSAARYHVVEIELDVDDRAAPLLVGARGWAKIETYRCTVYDLLADQITRVVRTTF